MGEVGLRFNVKEHEKSVLELSNVVLGGSWHILENLLDYLEEERSMQVGRYYLVDSHIVC